jgi:ABC-type polysaccharide/polyol phosphate export permease
MFDTTIGAMRYYLFTIALNLACVLFLIAVFSAKTPVDMRSQFVFVSLIIYMLSFAIGLCFCGYTLARKGYVSIGDVPKN